MQRPCVSVEMKRLLFEDRPGTSHAERGVYPRVLLVPAAQGSTKLEVITDGTCHLSSVVFCLFIA